MAIPRPLAYNRNMTTAWQSYETRKQRLIGDLQASHGSVALGKSTSNLFRSRGAAKTSKLNVRDFNQVIEVDSQHQTVDVMGMTTYEDLVEATLAAGFMPAVVPQLKSITIGGAIAGLGIESSSFKYGLVHETALEIEILLGDGTVVVATPQNEHQDLFYGFPNSYGTLGYVLRAKLKLIPVQPFVELRHVRFETPGEIFAAIGQITDTHKYDGQTVDFLDGVVFEPGVQYLTLCRMVGEAAKPSRYDYLGIYYQSIQKKPTDHLSIHDYIWRWDTDWFWCSKNIPGAQNRLLRLLFGKWYLRSTFYWKMMAINSRYDLMDKWLKLTLQKPLSEETVIQDIETPLDRAAEFLGFFQKQIGITPVWLCPLRAYNPDVSYPLYTLDSHQTYVNFGFWDTVPTTHPEGHYNKLVEREVQKLAGKKSLYSTSFYSEEEFWRIYNRPAYDKLKKRYDPSKRFRDLYEKCVGRS
jgi:FAD/FMN-containing dehydrogenase